MLGRDIWHDLRTIVVGNGANKGVLKLYIPQNYRNNSAWRLWVSYATHTHSRKEKWPVLWHM